jgi:hypothetical protein
MLQPDKVRLLADRAKHLTALHESPSFPVFKEIVEAKIRSETRRFIATPVVSQQELDYGRGLLNGLQSALTIIERGEAEFRKAMKQAQTLQTLEGVEGE